ncbi:MAG: serine/threonine protein kinase, partial [Polyangia bacterium]
MSSQRFPRMFGKYALLRPFARGGMGEIYLAAHGDLGGAEKLCLVKKVPEDRDAPGLTARLLDEAKVAVRLNHTNVVQVFDAGKVDDELYVAMELIEGR